MCIRDRHNTATPMRLLVTCKYTPDTFHFPINIDFVIWVANRLWIEPTSLFVGFFRVSIIFLWPQIRTTKSLKHGTRQQNAWRRIRICGDGATVWNWSSVTCAPEFGYSKTRWPTLPCIQPWACQCCLFAYGPNSSIASEYCVHYAPLVFAIRLGQEALFFQ